MVHTAPLHELRLVLLGRPFTYWTPARVVLAISFPTSISALRAESRSSFGFLGGPSSEGLGFPAFQLLPIQDKANPTAKLILQGSAGEGRSAPRVSVRRSVRSFSTVSWVLSAVWEPPCLQLWVRPSGTCLTPCVVSLQTPVKEPNSENVDISSGGGVTGWKSKCC